jgi:hypothetical protein
LPAIFFIVGSEENEKTKIHAFFFKLGQLGGGMRNCGVEV